METEVKPPTNLKECNKFDWCCECPFGDDGIDITNCEMRLKFVREKIQTTKLQSEKESKYLVYMWFNVRNVGQLKEALTLVSDDTKMDIDLRMIEDLTKNMKEMQFREPKEPRDSNKIK